jgi:hypothetical protein
MKLQYIGQKPRLLGPKQVLLCQSTLSNLDPSFLFSLTLLVFVYPLMLHWPWDDANIENSLRYAEHILNQSNGCL